MKHLTVVINVEAMGIEKARELLELPCVRWADWADIREEIHENRRQSAMLSKQVRVLQEELNRARER